MGINIHRYSRVSTNICVYKYRSASRPLPVGAPFHMAPAPKDVQAEIVLRPNLPVVATKVMLRNEPRGVPVLSQIGRRDAQAVGVYQFHYFPPPWRGCLGPGHGPRPCAGLKINSQFLQCTYMKVLVGPTKSCATNPSAKSAAEGQSLCRGLRADCARPLLVFMRPDLSADTRPSGLSAALGCSSCCSWHRQGDSPRRRLERGEAHSMRAHRCAR